MHFFVGCSVGLASSDLKNSAHGYMYYEIFLDPSEISPNDWNSYKQRHTRDISGGFLIFSIWPF